MDDINIMWRSIPESDLEFAAKKVGLKSRPDQNKMYDPNGKISANKTKQQ